MSDDRWERVADLYQAAQDRAPEDRSSFVRQATAGDSGLRREVESLLAKDDISGALHELIGDEARALLANNADVQPGSFIGAYRIDSLLGVGGMGEVYRARDTKLNRDVAIKILPPALATDPDRLARFKREAQVLASLNHPNIASIHGFEDSSAIHALVLELVDGPTLGNRIARGALPIDEALVIAKQIAEALEAAHEQGIIHRDLKPANIKVRDDGTVKVLDFGLAKALDPVGVSSANPSMSPTNTTPAMTEAGIIVGTAAYMAPEQARGKTVDRRADIWAFGVVLFEMLSGRRAFDGDDLSITLASVLKTEPDWQKLPSATPVGIRGLLRRCLEKDPKRRLQAIGEARAQIENLLSGAPGESVPVFAARPSPIARVRLAWAVAAAAFMAFVTVAAIALRLWWAHPSTEPAKVSFDIITDPSGAPNQIALSPDGTRLAAVVNTPKGYAVWLRRLDDVSSGQVLAGTVGSRMPFWSADSRFLAFFGGGKLNTIDLSGGPAVPVCDAQDPRGGTWNRDGWILFAPSDGPLFKCRTPNAVPLQVTALDRARGDMAHQHPKFLPDGVHFIFLVISTKLEKTGVYLGALNSHETRQLVASNEMGLFAAPDHLLFMRGPALMAQRFDARRLELEGDPFPIVAQDVGLSQTGNGVAGIAASDTGVLAYRIGGNSLNRVLRWVDRTGRPLGDAGEPGLRVNVALAPGGERLAETRIQGATSEIWITNLLRGGDSRLSFGPSRQDHAIWSPDGRQIVFAAGDGTVPDLYLGEPGSQAQAQPLWKSDSSKFPTDWSRDYILYTEAKNSYDVWVLPTSGDKKAFPFLNTASSESWARFSPDQQWVAYVSTETGPPQVYVQAFPHGGHKEQVSVTTGVDPHWRGDGRELFYATVDPPAIWSVDVTINDTDFKASVPHKIFDAALYRGTSMTLYDVTPDGQRFLLNTYNTNTSLASPAVLPPGAAWIRSPIRVVLNWNTTSKP